MKVGIDLRALQTGHKFRGIGEVAKQTTNRVIALAAADGHEVLFYEYSDDDPKALIEIPATLRYEVIKVGRMPENDKTATRQAKLKRNYALMYGSPVEKSEMSDVFLQFDYAFGVPKNTRTVLVKHDLIPYVFWDTFFESAWVPFKNKAARTTLRTLFANHKFSRQLRRGLKDAHVILAVSGSTKRDVERFFNVPADKTKVAHLGVDVKPAKTTEHEQSRMMPTKPYLLFIGAGDARRRVDDLVAAFNNLKADGHDLQLVLAGENFKSPEAIPAPATRKAVLQSSYKKDILTMGYIDDITKQTLYKNAIAYVYPTKYEGFGIPVLEAMLLECPIITYKNSSIPEVGGKYAIYARSWDDVVTKVKHLLAQPKEERRNNVVEAKKHAESFTWDKTAQVIYDELMAAGK